MRTVQGAALSLLSFSMACAHSLAEPTTGPIGPHPRTQATFSSFKRDQPTKPDRTAAQRWQFDIRLDEVREIAGEPAWQACVTALRGDWDQCELPVSPGFAIHLTATDPPIVRLDPSRLGSLSPEAPAIMLYRSTDQASTSLQAPGFTADDYPGTIATCPWVGPSPPYWGFPTDATADGTLMRTVEFNGHGQASPVWVLSALPEDACQLAGAPVMARCQEALSQGWTACTMPLVDGADLVASSTFSPKVEIRLRWLGTAFRADPQVEVKSQSGDRQHLPTVPAGQ